MIKRDISRKLVYLASKFPVISVTGPRQSGKTTLVKSVFAGHDYHSLEDINTREFAHNDPKGFLSGFKKGMIIDEIQRSPELLSYIQTIADSSGKAGRFVITGSQNLLVSHNISQTLAGRVAILRLLPFSINELKNSSVKIKNADELMFKGLYPRIYDKKIKPTDWYPNYIHTYLERDIRTLKNVSDLNTFQKFLKLCAGRTGQMLNLTSLGNDCGISHNTAKAWISILEASYIVHLLRPYHINFNKRLVKMPKLYFYDTGLVCSLLGIKSAQQLTAHYLRGSIFETMIISEIIKTRLNEGNEPDTYFWRDKLGNEIDCVIENANELIKVEIKSGKTINEDFFAGLRYWSKVSGGDSKHSYLIYGGAENQKRSFADVKNWIDTASIFKK